MGVRGICRFFCHRLFEGIIVVLLIVFLPNLPPYTSISEPFTVTPAKPFEGKLALNNKLDDAELWHKGDFLGPEAFAEYNGELYVSLASGDVVKLVNNHITPVIKLGKPCKGHYEESICGRPLGIKFDKNGALYVADAYYGIYRVNVKTGDKTRIISVDQQIDGKKPKLPNSIALASNGDIYWSDSSTQFKLEDGIFDLLADPSGRLIHYNAATQENTVLIDKIHFANGVALSEDEEFVIVAETARNRIHRYYLKGPKKGTHDIFIDGLPGLPDNLRPDGQGGFFVPLVISTDADHPSPFQMIGPFPYIRKFVARLFGITQLVFELINKVYPNEFAQKGIHFVGHFSSTGTLFLPKRTTVLRVDRSGNIVDSLHGLNKKVVQICDVYVYKDTLYLGSPFNDYLARIPLSKIGWEQLAPERKKRDVPVEQPKPKTTQAPTTTQRPTTTTTLPTTAKPTTTPPPKKQETPPPPPKQASVPKQQTPPPTKAPPQPKQAPPSTTTPTQTPPSAKQALPKTTQTPPPAKQAPPKTTQTPPSAKQAPPKTTQTPPPVKQAPPTATQAPPQKQPLPPATKPQGAPTPQKQETSTPKPQQAKQQTAPPPKPNPNQVPSGSQKPAAQKQTPPPVAQPIRDQPRSVPVNKN